MISRTLHRSTVSALLACVALSAPAVASAGSQCADADTAPAIDNAVVLRDATLCLLNAERASRGLRVLASSSPLRKAAQTHSDDMVRERFFDHVSPSGSTLMSRVRLGTTYLRGARRYALSENIAWGCGAEGTPRQTVQRWMESGGHRANVLNRRSRQVGVGVAPGAPEDSLGLPAATYTATFGQRTRA